MVREARVYRNRSDQVLLTGIGIVDVVAAIRLFAQPSTVGYEDYGYALFFAVIGWFCFRAGVRANVAVTPSQIRLVNLIHEVRFPPQEVAIVDADILSLFFIMRDDTKIRAWGAASSALNRLRKIQASITSTVAAADTTQEGGVIQTRLNLDLWFLILLYGALVADITFERLGWWR